MAIAPHAQKGNHDALRPDNWIILNWSFPL
jgi:hypothetical protein